mgnify:CR=1 FL=1
MERRVASHGRSAVGPLGLFGRKAPRSVGSHAPVGSIDSSHVHLTVVSARTVHTEVRGQQLQSELWGRSDAVPYRRALFD